LRHIAAIL